MYPTDFHSIYAFHLKSTKITVDIDKRFFKTFQQSQEPQASDTIVPLHYHPKTELIFVFESPLIVYTESEQRIFRNCIVMIPPFLRHCSQRTLDYRFLFSYESASSEHSAFSRFIEESCSIPAIFSFDIIKEEMRTYLEELRYVLNKPDELHNEITVSVLKLLFYHLFIYNRSFRGTSHQQESYLSILDQLIQDHYADPTCHLDFNFLAEHLHCSPKHASRIVIQYYKKPLSAVLTEKRLEFACVLLKTSDLSVAEIASTVQFHSENYFFIKFKKAYGITPLQYRKKHN